MKKIAPTLHQVVRGNGTASVDQAAQRELRALLSVARAARRITTDEPLAKALARLDRLSGEGR